MCQCRFDLVCSAAASGGDLDPRGAAVSVPPIARSENRVTLPSGAQIPQRQLAAASAFSVAFLRDRRLSAGDEDAFESRARKHARGFFDIALDLIGQHQWLESALARD